MMSKGSIEDTPVTWEDQQNINKFGRLNNRIHDLEEEIRKKRKEAEDLEDASNELILADEEEVRVLTGEVFVHNSKDEVENQLEKLIEKNQEDIAVLEEEKSQVLTQMTELKQILYGKFHDQINLEED